MKVKCLKIINEHTQQEEDANPWLTKGNEYIVFSIEVYTNKNYFLLIDDDSNHAPHLHDAKQFEIITHQIPSNWKINQGDLNITTLGPKSWHEPSFWERYYDGDESALELYKSEIQIIIGEEN